MFEIYNSWAITWFGRRAEHYLKTNQAVDPVLVEGVRLFKIGHDSSHDFYAGVDEGVVLRLVLDRNIGLEEGKVEYLRSSDACRKCNWGDA